MMEINKTLVIFASLLTIVWTHKKIVFDDSVCDTVPEFTDHLKQQIRSFYPDAQRIIDFIVKGNDRGVTYQELAYFTDRFGPRITGSTSLENSIDYILEVLKREQHSNIHTEDVIAPTWVRGREWAEIITPRRRSLNILGLGFSVGTNGNILTTEVVVVNSFDELNQRSHEVRGKFVVFNFKFNHYLHEVQYRLFGACAASKHGAVGALIRSVTPFSIGSPHTGQMRYNESCPTKIPGVSITAEDSELLQRMTGRGEIVRVSLYMEASAGPNVITRNVVSEVPGTVHPDQVVLVGGHIDSWDVGEGVMDDGGGVFISWRALSVIKKLGLQPKRTLRSVLFTAEETGLYGASSYAQRHKDELHKISIAMESDSGTFTPLGLAFSGKNPTAQCIVNEVLKILKPINASQMIVGLNGPDIEKMVELGVPGSNLETMDEKYFYYHHTTGDTISVYNTTVLDLCTAVWAVTSYVFASLELMIPR